MSSVQSLREFISERLTAAAEEIFTEFEKNIVRYEEEIDRQRRLLDISWKPQRNTTELHQQEEVLTDQQLCNQERDSSSDQEEPEPTQMKEEQDEPEPPQQEELCIGQDEEQLSVMQQTEEKNHLEPEKNIVQNKNEFDCRRRTLEISWSPHLKLHRIDLPQHHTWKEYEVLTDQWLCNQEEPGLPQIKGEQKDPEPSQEKPKTLEIKEEQQTETFMVTPVYKERNRGELEPNRDQWFFLNSSESENQVQEGSSRTDSGFSRDEELNLNKRSSQTRGHSDNVDHPKVQRNPKKCFVCLACGRKFSVKYNLTAHMRIHTGEKPFSCQICGKSYCESSSFKYHLKTHTGERPFPCETCGKSFICRGDLNAHIKIHTGEKPFSCETCGKSFISRCNLNAHIKIHTGEKPFSCETCGKSFISRSALSVHVKTHTGEKPFSCETCGKSFISRSALSVHMKTHTGEKPFSCETCGKSFILKCFLNKHMKSHRDHKV